MTDDLGHVAQQWGPYIGTALAGVLTWLKFFSDDRKGRQQAAAEEAKRRTDLIEIAQDVARQMIADLRAQVDAQSKEIAGLKAAIVQMSKEHTDMIAAKDAELALMRGQLRQWQALALSYEQLLTAREIPHEKPRQPFFGVDSGIGPTELVEGQLPVVPKTFKDER